MGKKKGQLGRTLEERGNRREREEEAYLALPSSPPSDLADPPSLPPHLVDPPPPLPDLVDPVSLSLHPVDPPPPRSDLVAPPPCPDLVVPPPHPPWSHTREEVGRWRADLVRRGHAVVGSGKVVTRRGERRGDDV